MTPSADPPKAPQSSEPLGNRSAKERAWIEENRAALEANARDIKENGLWCDRLRLF